MPATRPAECPCIRAQLSAWHLSSLYAHGRFPAPPICPVYRDAPEPSAGGAAARPRAAGTVTGERTSSGAIVAAAGITVGGGRDGISANDSGELGIQVPQGLFVESEPLQAFPHGVLQSYKPAHRPSVRPTLRSPGSLYQEALNPDAGESARALLSPRFTSLPGWSILSKIRF